MFSSCKESYKLSLSSTVIWQEVLNIADNLRPFTEQAMKMEVAPWIKDYVVDMEKLYTELTLEKIDNEPVGKVTTRIENYKELFEKKSLIQRDNSQSTKVSSTWFPWFFNLVGRMRGYQTINTFPEKYKVTLTSENVEPERGQKVLLKGDPGMGKTSLCKKVAWDWARKLFIKFSVTFLVFLKLVKPGDVIENVIIEQNPHMEGLKISPRKLHNVLETFGNSCLLILDGLDEHALGTNEDVRKIIRGQKYLNCNIIVTSRPHITKEIEQYFPVIVRVDGFELDKAKQFASKILTDQQKISAVLRFEPTNFRKDVPIYRCPILLSFLCLLVREDDIDLSNKSLHVGEIYTRMVRCLYKKFTIRKGIPFQRDHFIESMVRIGKLALETLISGNPLMRRSDVIKEVGSDAFDYGLLIGHEDFRLIHDETADIFVAFPHRSIQEFLGAFYFVWVLNKAEQMESFFVFKDQYPPFLINPLFLQFCLWILNCSEKYLDLKNRSQIYDFLLSVCLKYINAVVLDINSIAEMYPALDIEPALKTKDELRLKFMQDILVNVNKTNHIVVPDALDYTRKPLAVESSDILEWVLHSMGYMMKNLKLITCGASKVHVSYIPQKHILVNSEMISISVLNVILNHCNMNGLSVHLCLANPPKSFDQCVVGDFTALHVNLQDEWDFKLTEPAKIGFLKTLTSLSFVSCRSAKDISFLLSQCHLPQLKQLNLLKTILSAADLKSLCLACNGEKKTLPKLKSIFLTLPNQSRSTTIADNLFALPWLTLEEMYLHCNQGFYADMETCLCAALKLSKMPDLKCLGIQREVSTNPIRLEALSLETVHQVQSLVLNNCLPHDDSLIFLINLSKLEIRSCSGISGYLSVLLHEGFLCLHTLILSKCKLSSDDLKNLAQACMKSRLQKLRHLDLSGNYMNGSELIHLFDSSCNWNQLLSLNIRQYRYSQDVKQFFTKVKTDDLLTSLQEFMIDSYEDVKTYRPNLKTLGLFQCSSHSLQNVIDDIDRGFLPALRTICFQEFEPYDSTVVGSLSDRNIDCHKAFATLATNFKCYCQIE